jgi:hypothetical protein
LGAGDLARLSAETKTVTGSTTFRSLRHHHHCSGRARIESNSDDDGDNGQGVNWGEI